MKRPRPGNILGSGHSAVAASEADCAAFGEIAETYFHRIRRYVESDYDILLETHGFSTPGLDPCPALGSEGKCAIHTNRKPAGCRTVPLDALVPDRLQNLVLAERQIDAHFSGANCIKRGTNAGTLPLIRGPTVIDRHSNEAIAERRRNLQADKLFWGDAVFQLLEPELFSVPSSLARIPASGFLIMSIAPVLSAIAERSERCLLRCVEYLESQVALIDKVLQASRLYTTERAAASLTQLEAFARTNWALCNAMQTRRVIRARGGASAEQSAATEAWLELTTKLTPRAPSESGKRHVSKDS